MTRQINLAFVGCGFVAQQCHLPCFSSNENFNIICLADPYRDLAENLSVKYNIPRVAVSHHDVCNMDDVDAVIVTLPRPLTCSVVKDLAKAGKHVLTEKPLSLNSNSKGDLIEAVVASGSSVMTGYMRQHDNGTTSFKELVGSLGSSDICSIFAYCHMGDSYAAPFGDIKGSRLVDIEYSRQVLPEWLPKGKEYAYEQFINVFSHLTHTLEFIFNDVLQIISHKVNGMGEGQILCSIGDSCCTLELIRGSQYKWNEGIICTYRDQQVRLEFPPAFLRNQPAKVVHCSDADGTREIPQKWGWAFKNQSHAFYDFINSSKEYQMGDLLQAFRQVEFAESLFKQISI